MAKNGRSAATTAVGIGTAICILLGALGCSAPEEPSKDAVESRIREILSLPTFEHVYHDIVYLGEESKFLGIRTKDKQVLFSIDVTVKGGIDLTEGMEIDLVDKSKAIVSLPSAKILSVDADESTIRQYFVRDLGGGITALQYYDEINRKKEFLKKDAVARGILVRAEENAVELITNLLELMDYREVEFKNPGSAQAEPSDYERNDLSVEEGHG